MKAAKEMAEEIAAEWAEGEFESEKYERFIGALAQAITAFLEERLAIAIAKCVEAGQIRLAVEIRDELQGKP